MIVPLGFWRVWIWENESPGNGLIRVLLRLSLLCPKGLEEGTGPRSAECCRGRQLEQTLWEVQGWSAEPCCAPVTTLTVSFASSPVCVTKSTHRCRSSCLSPHSRFRGATQNPGPVVWETGAVMVFKVIVRRMRLGTWRERLAKCLGLVGHLTVLMVEEQVSPQSSSDDEHGRTLTSPRV